MTDIGSLRVAEASAVQDNLENMRILIFLQVFLVCFIPLTALGQVDAPEPQRGSITGTVTDAEDAAVPGAVVKLLGPATNGEHLVTSDETGSFALKDLQAAVPYEITVSAKGFADWTSTPIVLKPGQALAMDDIKLTISVVETTVVAMTVEQLARQQVTAAEKQRVFGVIPNFYVVYDKNAVPLSTKLKYELAFRAATDRRNPPGCGRS
jgi:hypothetical protein